MAITLNASTSSGFVQSADTSGEINLQSNGSTVLGLTSTGTTVTGTQSVSGNLSFNSGYGSSAVAYGCRAWVNFNGTGTVAIRASGNVSSITDNGTGDYTINLATAMPDANYSFTGATAWASGQPSAIVGSSTSSTQISAGSLRFFTLGNGSDALVDVTVASVSIFR